MQQYNDVDFIEDHLYLGNASAVQDFILLRSLKIKHVLSVWNYNLRHISDDITYKKIDVYDGYGTDLIAYFAEANEFIAGAQNAGHNVLVHCHMGVSRSATIVMAYLMQKYKWTMSEAKVKVESCRPQISPNMSFMEQLVLYQQMNYRIDAKNPMLRRMLIEIVFTLEWRPKPIGFKLFDRYYHRMDEFEKTTEDFDSGPKYVCVNCGVKLFNKINVIDNDLGDSDKSDPSVSCQWTYIEPQKWMSDQLNERMAEESDCLVKCALCQKDLVEYKKNFEPYACECNRHKDILKALRFRVANDSFKIDE